MKIKIGKYKNCQKKLKTYGFTEVEARIICAKVAISDTDWKIKEVKKKKSGFETEEEEEVEEEEDFGKRTTQAGGKTKPEKREIVTEPKAMQMPLYQPWRSYKSEHRLQTKLEKVLTAEQKFLTMEQLLKRAEYALAIKKKDSDPFIVYMIPEEIWDQTKMSGIGGTGKTVKEGPYAGQPIIGYFTKGEAHIPIIATPQGPKNVQQAEKEGVKIGKAGVTPRVKSINERLGSPRTKQHFEMRERHEVSDPLTSREKAAKKSAEKDIQTPYEELITQLEAFSKRTFGIKSPYQKMKERQEKKKSERISPMEEKKIFTKEQINQLKGLEVQIKNIEEHSSFQQIGTDPTEVQPDWDNLPQEDLWAYISRDLNFTLKGKSDEYAEIRASMGISPIIYGERRNVIHEMEAISRITNPHVLNDFIVHTKNYILKEQAMNQLKEHNPEYYKKNITEKITGPTTTKKAPTTYKVDPESAGYKRQEQQLNTMKKMKEQYMTQGAGGSHEYFTTKQEKGERNYPTTLVARQLGMKPDEEGEKFHDPDAGYQALEEMGLAEGGKIKTEPRSEELQVHELTGQKLKEELEVTPEEREMERFLKKVK